MYLVPLASTASRAGPESKVSVRARVFRTWHAYTRPAAVIRRTAYRSICAGALGQLLATVAAAHCSNLVSDQSHTLSKPLTLCSDAAHWHPPRDNVGRLQCVDGLPAVDGCDGAIGRGPTPSRADVDVAGQRARRRRVPATLRLSVLLGARRAIATRRPPSARSG